MAKGEAAVPVADSSAWGEGGNSSSPCTLRRAAEHPRPQPSFTEGQGASPPSSLPAAGGRRRADPARHCAPRRGMPEPVHPPGETPREHDDAANFRRK